MARRKQQPGQSIDGVEAALWDRYTAEPTHVNKLALWGHYQPWACSQANGFLNSRKLPMKLEDVLADVYEATMDSIGKFDPSRGLKFSTFALLRLRGAILDAVREADFVPRLTRARQRRRRELELRLTQSLGYSPTVEQLCETGEMTCDELADSDDREVLSLEKVVFDGEQRVTTLEGMLHAPEMRPETEQLSRDAIRRLFKILDVDSAIIMYLCHVRGVCMKDIGHGMGISESRVSQVHSRAMDHLRTTNWIRVESQAG